MVQVHEHLHRWRDPSGRFLTELMLGTGLRVGDAAALGFDPLVVDDDGHPYIHYWNHKMRRDAFVPIDRALLAKLREQQQRVAERYPDRRLPSWAGNLEDTTRRDPQLHRGLRPRRRRWRWWPHRWSRRPQWPRAESIRAVVCGSFRRGSATAVINCAGAPR
jgi:integrase